MYASTHRHIHLHTPLERLLPTALHHYPPSFSPPSQLSCWRACVRVRISQERYNGGGGISETGSSSYWGSKAVSDSLVEKRSLCRAVTAPPLAQHHWQLTSLPVTMRIPLPGSGNSSPGHMYIFIRLCKFLLFKAQQAAGTERRLTASALSY